MDLVALCIWREARSQHLTGMTAVASVIQNRARRHGQTAAEAVMVPWAFSSMTAHGDPQLGTEPGVGDPQFLFCEHLSGLIAAGTLTDTTAGSTLYYDDSIGFPHTWNRATVALTLKIGRLNFFREL